MPSILVIEGDPQLRAGVRQILIDTGFRVLTASDSALGVMAMYETRPDMVVLNEELPPVNNEELCSYIRRIFDIPIIVLVAEAEEPASSELLEMGADHCLSKPPSQRLLLAWVNQLFWRYSTRPSYNFPQCIDRGCEAQQVDLGDNTIELSPSEFRLLNCLALNSGRLVPYPELAIGVWGQEGISVNDLKVSLSRLKKRLANGSDLDFDLLNQRGVGYRFVMQ